MTAAASDLEHAGVGRNQVAVIAREEFPIEEPALVSSVGAD